MKYCIPLGVVWAAVLACATGCSDVPAKQASTLPDQKAQGGLNPKEELNKKRMADATKGLAFKGGFVEVSSPRPADAKLGESLRLKAEKITQIENAWFISVGAFRDAILADPTNAKSYEGLSRAFMMEGDVDHSKEALATAIKLDPQFSQARYSLGMMHQMQSDYVGAVDEWKALAGFDPGFKDVYARMAIASYYANDFSSAWIYLGEADQRKQSVPPQFRTLLQEVAPKP